MKVGILGSGGVGQALGTAFAALGHDVTIGSREAGSEKLKAWADKTGGRGKTASYAEAASHCEIGVLCTSWSGTENAIRLAEPKNLAGKVVMDVTNPLVYTPNAPPTLAMGHTDSGGETVQRWLPQARVVKVFNIVGSPHMFRPSFPGGPPDMFLCGNDAEAKKTVGGIVESFGWPSPIDLGGIEGARYLEPFAMVWILHGVYSGTWNHAFKLLKK